MSRPNRGQCYLGGDGEHEDPEDHRDLLVEVFLLAQEQPRSLKPAQSEHEEHFIEQRQRVCNKRMSDKGNMKKFQPIMFLKLHEL